MFCVDFDCLYNATLLVDFAFLYSVGSEGYA